MSMLHWVGCVVSLSESEPQLVTADRAGSDGSYAMAYPVTLPALSLTVSCFRDQSVLAALRSVVRAGCRSGGCGVCRIRIVEGRFSTGAVSAAHVSLEDRRNGISLACRTFPRGPLTIEICAERPGFRGLLRNVGKATSPQRSGEG